MDGENYIKLNKKDSADGKHHWIPVGWVESVDDKAVYLNKTQSEVMAESTKNLARKAQKLWLSGETRYCSKAASVPSAAPQPRQFLVQSWSAIKREFRNLL